VHTDVYDAFAEKFVARMKELTVGARSTRAPTSARWPRAGRVDVAKLVDDAVGLGATVLCGGRSGRAPAGSTRRR